MSAPIEIPRRVSAIPSSSSLSSSPSAVYVPIHKRRGVSANLPSLSSSAISQSSSRSSSPGLSSGQSTSSYTSSTPGVYSREDLLMLASSPLSHTPIDHHLIEKYPFILKENGEEIHRALQMTHAPEYGRKQRRGRQGRRGYNNNQRVRKNGSQESKGRSSDSDHW